MKRLFICCLLSMTVSGAAFAQESQLNLKGTATTFDNYFEKAELFQQRYTGLEKFRSLQRERVSYAALKNMMAKAGGKHGDNYISGVRVYYGLSEENQIIYYFVPLIANQTGATGNQKTFKVIEPRDGMEGILDDNNYDAYYVYNGQLYSVKKDGIERRDVLHNISRYRFGIKTIRGYAMNEAYSVFIPFQQIETLYNDNKPTNYNTGNIYFTSGAVFENGGYSHHLFLTTIKDYDEPYESNEDFKGMAVDASQLCAYECPAVTYPKQ